MENARSNHVLRLPSYLTQHSSDRHAMNAAPAQFSAALDPKESSSLAPPRSIFLLCNI
jgi:hypothetical protein